MNLALVDNINRRGGIWSIRTTGSMVAIRTPGRFLALAAAARGLAFAGMEKEYQFELYTRPNLRRPCLLACDRNAGVSAVALSFTRICRDAIRAEGATPDDCALAGRTCTDFDAANNWSVGSTSTIKTRSR